MRTIRDFICLAAIGKVQAGQENQTIGSAV